ncbi:MAG: hypothetical protein FWD31_11885 [Planctomycetaceae bacterium]|nr:hypothetical protein [Planctomycetaceae bacterium]
MQIAKLCTNASFREFAPGDNIRGRLDGKDGDSVGSLLQSVRRNVQCRLVQTNSRTWRLFG